MSRNGANSRFGAAALKDELLGETGLEHVSLQDIYREILRRFDEDPSRDGLLRTPERMEKSLTFLTKG